MNFDYKSLMELADQFDQKAEQLLETAESIRETAEIMTAGQKVTREEPAKEEPKPEPVKTQAETKVEAKPKPPAEAKPPVEKPLPPPIIRRTPIAPPSDQGPSIFKEPSPPPECFNPPQMKIPKRINGKTKFAPMEKLILAALEDRPKGLDKKKIISYCRRNGNVGTVNSITTTLVKLKKNGFVTNLERGVYALTNAMNQN